MQTAQVRTTVLCGWTDFMQDFGVSVAQALEIAGVHARSAARASDMIPLTNFTRMAEFVGDQASCSDASWLIGENYDISELGEVGLSALGAQTLGGALRRLTDTFELLQDASRLNLDTNAETATISYRILDPSIWPRHQDALFSLGIIAKVIKLAVPDAMQFMELGFECCERKTGLKLSDSQITFECEANSIRIPVSMLDRAMPAFAGSIDPKALSRDLARRRRQRSACERLSGIIFSRLSYGEINQDQLARQIGMSSRTLRRRLADEETSFQQLLDDCRMRQAVLEFRCRPHASIADIALRLGYAEHSTFTRAFTRWANMPPQRFRAELNIAQH